MKFGADRRAALDRGTAEFEPRHQNPRQARRLDARRVGLLGFQFLAQRAARFPVECGMAGRDESVHVLNPTITDSERVYSAPWLAQSKSGPVLGIGHRPQGRKEC